MNGGKQRVDKRKQTKEGTENGIYLGDGKRRNG